MLKVYNAIYQKNNAWVVYSNFMNSRVFTGSSYRFDEETIKKNEYRKDKIFHFSHLRSYYTKLFRLIKEEDLQDNEGEYFQMANDVAIAFPVLEMAHEKVVYVPEILYFYNMDTELNNHRNN